MSRDGRLSNPDVQRRLKDMDIKMAAREAADLDAIMSTEFGRRWFYRLVFQIAALEAASYHNSGQAMAYQEGRRSVAIQLMQEAHAVCPELWMSMLKERLSVAEYERAQREEAYQEEGD